MATNETPATGDRYYKSEHYVWWESATGDVRACDIKTGREFAVPDLRGHLVDETSTTHAEARAILGDKWPATWPQGEAPATGQGDDMLVVHDPAEALKALATPEGVAALSLAAKDVAAKATGQGGHTPSPYAPGQPKFGKVCEHGTLERKCEVCERDATIRELREACRVLAEECDASRRTHLDVTSSPNVRTHRRLTDKNPIATAALRAAGGEAGT